MDHCIGPGRALWRLVGYLPATAMLVVLSASGAIAQTLTDPNVPHIAPHSPAAKSPPTVHVKSCSAFGAGFFYVPGTDTCIKSGGYFREEGATNLGR
jgi:Porin subfamily